MSESLPGIDSRGPSVNIRVTLAWRNITHRKTRSLVALSGVAGTVLMMLMQIGFYSGLLSSVTAIYRAMDADIFIVSSAYLQFVQPGTLPRERLFQAKTVAGVRDAEAFFVDAMLWRNPQTRERYRMLVMGIAPTSNIFGFSRETMQALGDGRVLIDTLTRPRYGPQDTGTVTEIGDRQVRIAGHYRMGPGLTADGAIIADDDTFVRILGRRTIDRPSLLAVRLDAGADPERVAAALRQTLPPDTRVFTRSEMIRAEERFWTSQTSMGPIFRLGAALGFVIGIVILYQIMASDIANRIREYATLKAIGYEDRSLRGIVLQEGSIFAVTGFIIGALLSTGLYSGVRAATSLPITMTPERLGGIFVLTFMMCWFSGLLATRKLRTADPAELF
jgi:putative ABC transport system permease protein